GAASHHGSGHAPLLRAIPDWRVAAPPLVIGVEPSRHFAELLHVLDGSNTAAKIPHIHGLGALLGHDGLPLTPHLEHASHVDVEVLPVDGARGVCLIRRNSADQITIDALAAAAMADGDIAGTRPAIREKT